MKRGNKLKMYKKERIRNKDREPLLYTGVRNINIAHA